MTDRRSRSKRSNKQNINVRKWNSIHILMSIWGRRILGQITSGVKDQGHRSNNNLHRGQMHKHYQLQLNLYIWIISSINQRSSKMGVLRPTRGQGQKVKCTNIDVHKWNLAHILMSIKIYAHKYIRWNIYPKKHIPGWLSCSTSALVFLYIPITTKSTYY